MYDLDRINIIISDILAYIKKLESLEIKSLKSLEDDRNFYSSSMLIFNSVNRTIDLAEQIFNDLALGTPYEYKDLFEVLEHKKIISLAVSEGVQDLIRLRNKISHRYGKITKENIFNSISNIDILKTFIKEIQKEISKK